MFNYLLSLFSLVYIVFNTNLHASQLAQDDTEYIQLLIDNADAGETVVLPEKVYFVRSLNLKSGVNLTTSGLIKQLPLPEKEEYSLEKQYSSNPLFFGKNVRDVHLTFNAETRNEAVVLENSSNVTLERIVSKGDSTKFRSFSGVYLYKSDSITVSEAELSNYGQKRKSEKYYQPGTGIRVQTCKFVTIDNSTIYDNGENGIFIHASSNIDLTQNYIHHNGMSGIQVAFGSGGLENMYSIFRNRLEYNAADGIDINNPDEERKVELDAKIIGNQSIGNGWVNSKKTPDGSGIATLVGLKNVYVKDNKSEKSNRPAIYVRTCDQIELEGNQADNVAELVGELGNIYMIHNQLAGLRLLKDVNATLLSIDSNEFRHVSLPSDIRIDTLKMVANNIKGNIHFNMIGNLIFSENKLYSPSPKGAVSLIKVNGATLNANEIESTKNHALLISHKAKDVIIKDNQLTALNTCIRDMGSANLKLIGNKIHGLERKDYSLVMSKTPELIHKEYNEYFIDGEKKENVE